MQLECNSEAMETFEGSWLGVYLVSMTRSGPVSGAGSVVIASAIPHPSHWEEPETTGGKRRAIAWHLLTCHAIASRLILAKYASAQRDD